jgi:demethylmenaquinone methyltransferase/2-methoxy-6-polyprenyl-1,4-benzoquinol methylase
MFTSIAPHYDLLNHLLSLNLDRRWRRRTARTALEGLARPRVLDLCTGTGDLALEIARRAPEAAIDGLDFVFPMLERMRRKVRRAGLDGRIRTVCGDGFHLPYRDGAFDAVTVAFGLRNLSPPDEAIDEVGRVLRPGGRFVILEFALPKRGLWARVYSFYFFRVLPKLGKWISGTSAYSYLPASVALFPEPPALSAMLEAHGFTDARRHPLAGGVLALHVAIRRKI